MTSHPTSPDRSPPETAGRDGAASGASSHDFHGSARNVRATDGRTGDELDGADLARAAAGGVEPLVHAAMKELRLRAGVESAEFISDDESDRLPAADSAEAASVLPIVFTFTTAAEVEHGTDRRQTLGWLVVPGASAEQMRPWVDWLAGWIGLATTIERLREMAFTDELTKAGNRRDFERFLPEALAHAKERGRPLSLMVFDIDNFKRYNDEFGHDAGDAVLVETVSLLRAVIRRGDRVFRIGGDEFVVVFADQEGQRAAGAGHIESVDQLVGRFRKRIAELCLPQLGHAAPGTVTVSAGLATYPWDGDDVRSLVAHADRLALESKRRGKNVITFGPGGGSNAPPTQDAASD